MSLTLSCDTSPWRVWPSNVVLDRFGPRFFVPLTTALTFPVILLRNRFANNVDESNAYRTSLHRRSSLSLAVQPFRGRDNNYSATSNDMKLVHCPLTGGLLHLVQRGGDWAGYGIFETQTFKLLLLLWKPRSWF